MKKKIMILGANSFSGQDLVDMLLDDPEHEVVGVSRSKERSKTFLKYKERNGNKGYRFYSIDMNKQMPELLDLLDREQPSRIVNFTAQGEVAPSWDRPEDWFETNCVALAKMINHLRKKDYVKRYLHISSPEVYGTCVGNVKEDGLLNPSTPYAASKAAADLLLLTYLKQFNFPLLTVRSTNVYGARQQLYKIIPRSVIYMKMGKKIQLHGGGKAIKSYIHIRDVSKGEIAILEKGKIGQLYHLSPDSGISINDLVQKISKVLGKDFKETTQVVEERPGQDAAYIIDSTKARKELGWKPNIGIDEGLKEVIDWVNGNWKELSKSPLDYQHRT